MELRHLRYFIKAAELLHFSHAADELGIAQPALSQQMKQLETELGCRLFDRSNKWKLELTESGRVFLDDARRIVSDADAARTRALQAAKGDCGSLSIDIIPSFFSSEKFFETLAEMRRKYPNVFLKVSKHSSANILRRVERGELDFGIIRVVNPLALGTKYIEIGREKIMLAVPEKHRLAKAKKIRLRDLKNEGFVMLPPEESPFFYRIIDVALKREGVFSPRIAEEIYNFDAILKLLPSSNLVSFVPELLNVRDYYKGVRFKTVEDLDADMRYVGIWREARISKPLENFIGILKRKFGL